LSVRDYSAKGIEATEKEAAEQVGQVHINLQNSQ
jgi:hypothetical protein